MSDFSADTGRPTVELPSVMLEATLSGDIYTIYLCFIIILYLNVNIDKTKITVFRNGGYLKKNESWKYHNRPLEIVSCYKYLGVHITSRGIWTECQKSKADQANKILFSLKTIFKQFYNLQPNILMKIFDSKILPILHYGSEVWGFHEGKNVDLVHTKYCKFILGVNLFQILLFWGNLEELI